MNEMIKNIFKKIVHWNFSALRKKIQKKSGSKAKIIRNLKVFCKKDEFSTIFTPNSIQHFYCYLLTVWEINASDVWNCSRSVGDIKFKYSSLLINSCIYYILLCPMLATQQGIELIWHWALLILLEKSANPLFESTISSFPM